MGKEVFTIAMREINKVAGNSTIYIKDIYKPITGVYRIQMIKGNARIAKALLGKPTDLKEWTFVFDINDLISFQTYMDVEEKEDEQEEDTY